MDKTLIKNKREKAGKLAVDAMEKQLITTDAVEQGKEMTSTYMDELKKTFAYAKTQINDNFYLIVLTKREALLKNIIRNYFFYRYTCPTPDYDQAVYRYVKADDNLSLLWVIPSKEMCTNLIDNALSLDPEYKELLSYVLDFYDLSLFKKAKILNSEDKLEGKVVLKEIHE